MKTSGMLIKYYFFCLLVGLVFGFNQYAFKISIPIYVTSLVTVIILWGLIYSTLKECSAEYSKKNIRSVIIGVTLPNALILYFFPSYFGLSHQIAVIAALISILIGGLVVWVLFHISKGMVTSIPLNDDYNS